MSVVILPDHATQALYDAVNRLTAELKQTKRERDEERQLHAESSARYHDAARRTCTSLADQLATAQCDLATARTDLRLANMTIHATRQDAVEQTVAAIVAFADEGAAETETMSNASEDYLDGWRDLADNIRRRAWLPAAAGEGK